MKNSILIITVAAFIMGACKKDPVTPMPVNPSEVVVYDTILHPIQSEWSCYAYKSKVDGGTQTTGVVSWFVKFESDKILIDQLGYGQYSISYPITWINKTKFVMGKGGSFITYDVFLTRTSNKEYRYEVASENYNDPNNISNGEVYSLGNTKK